MCPIYHLYGKQTYIKLETIKVKNLDLAFSCVHIHPPVSLATLSSLNKGITSKEIHHN